MSIQPETESPWRKPDFTYGVLGAFQLLDDHFASQPTVFVGANMFLYYVKGNRRKHISPDVFVTRGIAKEPPRDCYLVWEEGKAPDFVLEITSKSTRGEDKKKKFVLCRDVLKVPEYFMFDPRAEYLDPPLQGFRLNGGDYIPIEPVAGRLPSEVLGLHLDATVSTFDFSIRPRVSVCCHRLRARGRRAACRQGTPARQRRTPAPQRRTPARQRRTPAPPSRNASAPTTNARAPSRNASAPLRNASAEAAEAVQRNLAEENERLRREIEAFRQG